MRVMFPGILLTGLSHYHGSSEDDKKLLTDVPLSYYVVAIVVRLFRERPSELCQTLLLEGLKKWNLGEECT